ncbi:DUF937 domain-containing protein [Deinococcus altitudinis]|uniref:DUF937 domain-containing protein n=1 Tax=Deinococcus altitudinis TaxID=468914 RepID=UPI0038915293
MNLQEYLREQLNLPLVSKLGTSMGLKATQAAPIADEVLPAQLATLQKLVSTPAGAQSLLDLARDRVPAGTVGQLTGTPQQLAKLQQAGAGLLPEVMGASLNTEVQRVAASTKASEANVRRMMELLLPLLLGLIAGRATREKLTPVTLGTLFGGAVLGTAAAGAVVGSVSSTPEVVIEKGAPVTARTAIPNRPAPPVQEEPRRRGLGWLWLLPLLLLLLLGGCFLLRGKGVAGLTLTGPASAARVDTGRPVTFAGTGRAGETVTVSESGTAVTTTKVGTDGQYSAEVPAPAAGTHTYTVSETGTDVTLNRVVTAAAAAAVPAAVPAASSSTSAPSTTLAISTPAGGNTVLAGALTLKGTGPANTSLNISEDGSSLGQTQTDATGAWTFEVPGPAAGSHTYTASAGQDTATLKLNVTAGTAQMGPCTKAFSLSLKDGQTVSQPFRFGGVGSGKSYVVEVSRPDRRIGQKTLPLDSSCSYSYTSKPGVGKITYTLRETGQDTVATKITLNVTK